MTNSVEDSKIVERESEVREEGRLRGGEKAPVRVAVAEVRKEVGGLFVVVQTSFF